MREIKFRGYSKTKKCWIYGLPQYFADKVHSIQTKYRTAVQIDNRTLGQYTGLKDNYGVEIYEGDAVRVKDTFGLVPKFIGVVDFQDGSFVIKEDSTTHYRWVDYETEVIGNIYEDPYLLEVCL